MRTVRRYVRGEAGEITHASCGKCQELVPASLFPSVNASASGLGSTCKPCRNKKHRAAYSADGEGKRSMRSRHLRLTYGIGLEECEAMMIAQGGVCAMCGSEETSTYRGNARELAVDHCHDTGKVRALLCSSCNIGIGALNHDRELLLKAIAYLDSHA